MIANTIHKRKTYHFNYRTNLQLRIMKEDWDLFREKAKALGLSYAEAVRLIIKQFNETVFVTVNDK